MILRRKFKSAEKSTTFPQTAFWAWRGHPRAGDGGRCVHRCVNLGWGVFDVRTALEETVGLPVVVVNDANAAAMGEAWKGGGRGSENVVFITLGTGVGGAVISDGRMMAGANGRGG